MCGIGFGTLEALHVHFKSQKRPTASVDRGKRDLLQSHKSPTVSGDVSASPARARENTCGKGFGSSGSEALHVHTKLEQQHTTANAEEDALAGGGCGGGEWGGGLGGGRGVY